MSKHRDKVTFTVFWIEFISVVKNKRRETKTTNVYEYFEMEFVC